MVHKCQAKSCEISVPLRMLMCKKHWSMVSRKLQDQVWKHYRSGQEKEISPSPEYLKAAQDAIDSVAAQEGI